MYSDDALTCTINATADRIIRKVQRWQPSISIGTRCGGVVDRRYFSSRISEHIFVSGAIQASACTDARPDKAHGQHGTGLRFATGRRTGNQRAVRKVPPLSSPSSVAYHSTWLLCFASWSHNYQFSITLCLSCIHVDVAAGGISPYMPIVFMPQHRDYWEYFSFRSPAIATERQRWVACFRDFLHKVTFAATRQARQSNGGIAESPGGVRRTLRRSRSPSQDPSRRRRLLLKSPCHTARIALLLEEFPDAQFIYLHRDPCAPSALFFYTLETWLSATACGVAVTLFFSQQQTWQIPRTGSRI